LRESYAAENPWAPTSKTPRLFYMSSTASAGQRFEVNEVLCPFRNIKVKVNSMPFRQEDLYIDEQPALFLLDTGVKLWLWQGWWPETDCRSNADNFSENNSATANNLTGSAMIRWHAERRAAMQTAADYRRVVYGRGARSRDALPPSELVWAGAEPTEFTNLFPVWRHDAAVEALNKKFIKDCSLETTLAELSRSTYSWEELQRRPLPDGVDPAKLEKYLSDQDFQKYLGLTRGEFIASPRWKQLEIRKEKGLF